MILYKNKNHLKIKIKNYTNMRPCGFAAPCNSNSTPFYATPSKVKEKKTLTRAAPIRKINTFLAITSTYGAGFQKEKRSPFSWYTEESSNKILNIFD